uniref:Reverse transcriptase domain-containing protein n=1 Tax=Meloidogyne enterolobii TaxID=390850 RepID=A0A6V7XLE3_MELEN|nr:unnamed protein product [Meloidogyne enterolobii]
MAAVLQAGINMLRDRLGRHLDTARQIDFSVSSHNTAFCRTKPHTENPLKRKNEVKEIKEKRIGIKNNQNNKNSNICLEIQDDDNLKDSNDILINYLTKNSQNSIFPTFLQVTQAKIVNPKIPILMQNAHVFLDSGAEICLIKTSLAEKLKLEPIAINNFKATGVFGQSMVRRMPIFDFEIKCINNESIKVRARGVDENFVEKLKTIFVEKIGLDKLNENRIPYEFVEEVTPEILIGTSVYNKIMGYERLQNGFSVIQTKLGKVLSGRGVISLNVNESKIFSMENVEKFWELESFGITDNPLNEDDKNALELFKKSVTRTPEGRYEIEFPFKEKKINISSNFAPCIKRLQSSWAKGNKEGVLEKMKESFLEQAKNNQIENCERNDSNLCHYIPWHYVYHPQKKKMRIVFAANCKTAEEKISLNDIIYRGPVLLPDLCGLLIRIRTFPILTSADVKSAFHQIGLKENQRDLMRFLLPKNWNLPPTNLNLAYWRWTKMPFGISAAPFCLAAVINLHLEKTAGEFGRELRRGIYADNIFFSAITTEEGLNKCKKVIEIFKEAQMPLQEFISNSEIINKNFGDKALENNTKILGVGWDVKKDALIVEMKKN